jgi:phosphoglycerol transferase MdoB-like AlkP superfamily enzyme
VTCLSDLLHEAGYYQVFIGSSSRKFTNKDYFLSSHHFDEVYGNEDFEAKYKFFHTNSWGIDDPHLIKEALDKIDQIREQGPFSLMMLTMNTHKPGYPSPYCPSYQKGNRYLEAIHCTDFAMGKFFAGLEERGIFEDTVIVLVGDHMAFPNAHTQRDLGSEVASRYYGNVFLAFHSPLEDLPDEIDTFNYSPDIAPTILDLMGFELSTPFLFGKSILGERSQYPHLVGPDMEIFDGELYPKKRRVLAKDHCNELRLRSTRITEVNRNLEACERMRIISRVDRWLQTATPDAPEPGESVVDNAGLLQPSTP